VQAVFNAGGFKGLIFYGGQVFQYAKQDGGEKVDAPQIRENVAQIQKAGLKVIGPMPPMWEMGLRNRSKCIFPSWGCTPWWSQNRNA
jgi:hypothetical protein